MHAAQRDGSKELCVFDVHREGNQWLRVSRPESRPRTRSTNSRYECVHLANGDVCATLFLDEFVCVWFAMTSCRRAADVAVMRTCSSNRYSIRVAPTPSLCMFVQLPSTIITVQSPSHPIYSPVLHENRYKVPALMSMNTTPPCDPKQLCSG
jgi:hypothetical protein